MAKVVTMENGVTKTSKTSRRKSSTRNGAKAKTSARRSTTKNGALGWAKRHGMKLVKRGASAVQNPRKKKHHHKRKRRNGIASRNNGLFGNTKHDAQQVGGVLLGMAGTKIISRFVNGFAAPFLAQVGVGNYSQILSEAATALVIVPMIASKIAPRYKDNARLGGLAVVGISLIDIVGGGAFSALNPFNTSPVVMNGGQALVAPKAVTALVNSTSASAADKAKVASAMNALEAGAYPVYSNPSPNPSMMFE